MTTTLAADGVTLTYAWPCPVEHDVEYVPPRLVIRCETCREPWVVPYGIDPYWVRCAHRALCGGRCYWPCQGPEFEAVAVAMPSGLRDAAIVFKEATKAERERIKDELSAALGDLFEAIT